MIKMKTKKVFKNIVRWVLILVVGVLLGFGWSGMKFGQDVAVVEEVQAQEMQTEDTNQTEETTQTEETADATEEENAVLFLVMGGGLIIILGVVITVVSSVTGTIGAVSDEI